MPYFKMKMVSFLQKKKTPQKQQQPKNQPLQKKTKQKNPTNPPPQKKTT